MPFITAISRATCVDAQPGSIAIKPASGGGVRLSPSGSGLHCNKLLSEKVVFMRYRFFRIAVILVVMLSAFSAMLAQGCAKDTTLRLGIKIPPAAKVVKLADIIADPAAYNGKSVVIKGVISGQCPSLCEFFYKEGLHQTTIFPQGFKFPKLPVGNPVTVLAHVTAGSENVVLSATGIVTQQE